ncbi:MAG: ribosome recycling factor [Actinomycetota bacterium]|nr:ribosome recycling factor [Actinomycetota bacterium]
MSEESLVELALHEGSERMHRAVEHAKAEFASVRTGRAMPALVEKLRVEYFGADVPLQQLAGITVPEARVLVVHPYDKGSLKAIEKSIQLSDLGVNPSNDGSVIRLVFPQLTEQRRKELVKVVRQRAEDSRVAVRAARRAVRQDLEALERDGDISTDDLDRAEKELEKRTHELVAEIDRLLAHKEQELLDV